MSKTTKETKWDFATKAIHSKNKNENNAINKPIYYSAAFEFDDFDSAKAIFSREKKGYIYSRWDNPTTNDLGQKIATLEHGQEALTFSSGMAAISATFLSFLATGDHIIFDHAVYGCSFTLITKTLKKFGIKFDTIDFTQKEQLIKTIKSNTKIIFFESITNPTLKLINIADISQIIKKYNPNIKIIVDNTFATPYNLNPLLLGADIVVHSATKFISGHNDALGGIVVTKDYQTMITIKEHGLRDIGSVMSPMDAFLINRGLTTLALRLEKASANALTIAKFLQSHPKVHNVCYLGLDNHQQYQLGKKQLKLPGTIISFEIKGNHQAVNNFLDKLKLIKLSVSFGSVQTLIENPYIQTHKAFDENDLKKAKITSNLIRLACGIEDINDLINDLQQGLN